MRHCFFSYNGGFLIRTTDDWGQVQNELNEWISPKWKNNQVYETAEFLDLAADLARSNRIYLNENEMTKKLTGPIISVFSILYFSKNEMDSALTDLGGTWTHPPGPKFLIFMHFLRDNWPNNKVPPPPIWNWRLPSGFATFYRGRGKILKFDRHKHKILVFLTRGQS